MSNEKQNGGGAAFPAMGERNTPQGTAYVWNEGMTLRDYFAAKAMQGMVANPSDDWGYAQEICELAYKYADAMLKAREEWLKRQLQFWSWA